MRVGIIIPAHNVQNTLSTVVDRSSSYASCIVIINDGSTDATQKVAQDLAVRNSKVMILTNETNIGKSETIKRGLAELVGNEEVNCILQIDADMEHDPDDIPTLFSSMNANDMVIGNRYSDVHMDPHRNNIHFLSSLLVHKLTSYALNDPFCGFRLYTKAMGRCFARYLSASGYSLELEQIILAKAVDARITETNISSKPKSLEESNIKELADILRVSEKYLPILPVVEIDRTLIREAVMFIEKREDFSIQLEGKRYCFVFHSNQFTIKSLE